MNSPGEWPKWSRMTLWAFLGKQFSRAFVNLSEVEQQVYGAYEIPRG
jgi:hypothetical protein